MIERIVILALAGFVACFAGAGPARAQNCLSGSCHQNLTKARYLHGPVAAEMAGHKACVVCHMPRGTACTASKGGVFKLKTGKLCLTCHDKGTSTEHSQAHTDSRCLFCHDPHGSDLSPNLLRPKVE